MGTKSVAEKLGVDAGDRVLLLNASERYESTLGSLPPDVELRERPAGTLDVVQVFSENPNAFEDSVRDVMDATADDGRLWITYPKKSGAIDSDLSRDVLAEMMDDLGWRGARQIAIDETWSAIWFRPRD